MKSYKLIIATFILTLLFIAYFAYESSRFNDEAKAYSKVKESAYRLEIAFSKNHLLMNSINSSSNNDEISASIALVERMTREHLELLGQVDDRYLRTLADSITQKSAVLALLYEDLKSDNAQLQNSIMWLSKSYKDYLFMLKEGKLDEKTMSYIFDIVNARETKELIRIHHIKPNEKLQDAQVLDLHLGLIQTLHELINEHYAKLLVNDITPELKSAIDYSSKKIELIKSEFTRIILLLLISITFLVIFSILLYSRELATKNALKAAQNSLQQFVDALNESAIVSKSDPTGRITFVNKKFCEISGYSQNELIGHSHNIIRHPDMPKELFKEMWDTIKSGKHFKATIQNMTKEGSSYYVDSLILPLFDVNGEIVEYMAVRYDVTELILSRDRALKAEKAKDEFFSKMSHELRTPLNAINGFSSILKRELKEEKQQRYLQYILDSSKHLIELINDILDLSKLNSGNFKLDIHKVDLYHDMESLLHRFEGNLESSKITFHKELESSIEVTLYADWLRISQIITNIISNAIKFTPQNGDIFFRASYENAHLKFSIKDSGIGMSPDVLERVFKPFEQADSSTTRRYGGTGLGLSIVSNLVGQMNATMNVTSKEGEGTLFEFSIPLQAQKAKPKGHRAIERSDSDKLFGHILVAEDNKTNQLLVKLLLEEFGLTCTIAKDGQEALEIYPKENFDAVLMDENMPRMNGIEAFKEIRRLYGDKTPVIALTANVMKGDRERFLEVGMSGFIPKPIDEQELYKTLQSLLGKH